MLLLKNRLKADRDFKRVLKIGRFFNSKEMRVKAAANNLPYSRFGFVISTAVDKRSVVRNRIKRQTREVVRLLFKKDLIVPGFDVIFILGRGLKDLSFLEIEQKVVLALNYLKILKV
ncbi:MAG TPA: ribonuclease P protein component [Candidatus Magasanikbacteria bacterium]|nr:ribonuclease P protein component [Candidatus Magasanikbacteria bacterium]